MDKLAQRVARHRHPPRHPKVDDQRFPRRQIRQNIFRTPSKTQDSLARQAFGHPFGKGPAQIGSVHMRGLDHGTLHTGHQTATDCLDLG